MHYVWVIIIGFVAGLIARFIMPGPNNPSGFIMTTVLGIAGSFLANFIATKIGWANGGEGMSLLSGIVGAMVLLLIYHLISNNMSSTV